MVARLCRNRGIFTWAHKKMDVEMKTNDDRLTCFSGSPRKTGRRKGRKRLKTRRGTKRESRTCKAPNVHGRLRTPGMAVPDETEKSRKPHTATNRTGTRGRDKKRGRQRGHTASPVHSAQYSAGLPGTLTRCFFSFSS